MAKANRPGGKNQSSALSARRSTNIWPHYLLIPLPPPPPPRDAHPISPWHFSHLPLSFQSVIGHCSWVNVTNVQAAPRRGRERKIHPWQLHTLVHTGLKAIVREPPLLSQTDVYHPPQMVAPFDLLRLQQPESLCCWPHWTSIGPVRSQLTSHGKPEWQTTSANERPWIALNVGSCEESIRSKFCSTSRLCWSTPWL